MKYRFRKFVERPDWDTPLAANLEITYEATSAEVDDMEESGSTGGITQIEWSLVGVKGTAGHYHNPEIFPAVLQRLLSEPNLNNEIEDYAYEDLAQRTKEI